MLILDTADNGNLVPYIIYSLKSYWPREIWHHFVKNNNYVIVFQKISTLLNRRANLISNVRVRGKTPLMRHIWQLPTSD